MMLARYVAKTTDVDGMLHSMTPEQFNEWVAMFSIWNAGETEDKPSLEDSLKAMRGLAGV